LKKYSNPDKSDLNRSPPGSLAAMKRAVRLHMFAIRLKTFPAARLNFFFIRKKI
jgi:hypothetical protein